MFQTARFILSCPVSRLEEVIISREEKSIGIPLPGTLIWTIDDR
jgi:hypothetical protein